MSLLTADATRRSWSAELSIGPLGAAVTAHIYRGVGDNCLNNLQD